MNEITLNDAIQKLGKTCKKQIFEFSEFLQYSIEDQARYAPSIITRSEAMLFCTSIPRFAIRLYFSNRNGFINCRRLKDFIDNVESDNDTEWGQKIHDLPQECKNETQIISAKPKSLRKVLGQFSQSCIADCLISPPNYLPFSKYDYVKARLSSAYGESSKDSKQLDMAVPYVKNIVLGGGLCAQAVCYMGTAILHEYADRVCGLAEITALAHPPECRELCISGLTIPDIARYFLRVGLAATQQAPTPPIKGSTISPRDLRQELAIALRAYIRSGFPVIFPTDMGLLAFSRENLQKSIYEQNGFSLERNGFDLTIPHTHAVILIGCESHLDKIDPEIVFHDPSVFPFMSANVSQLEPAGHYLDNAMTHRDDRLILPITPNAVKMPLLWCRKSTTGNFDRGLLWLSSQLHGIPGSGFPSVELSQHKPTFLLTQLKYIHRLKTLKPLCDELTRPFSLQLAEFHKQSGKKFNWTEEHWIWVETNATSIWIWDAEIEMSSSLDYPQLSNAIKNYLRAVVFQANGRVVCKWTE